MNNHIFQHFSRDEQFFIENIADIKRRVEDTYIPFTSFFMDPREQVVAQYLFSKNDIIRIFFDGGFSAAERKKCVITVADKVSVEDFSYVIVEIKYPSKFETLSHGAILGSFIGSGIKRELIGDIITDGLRWFAVIDRTIVSFLSQNVTKIGRVPVSLAIVSLLPIEPSDTNVEIIQLLTSSMRLDSIIAKAYKLSRHSAVQLIENGSVKLNWEKMTKGTQFVQVGDTISVKRFGRIQIDELLGKTKSDKFKVQIKRIKSK